MRYLFLRLYLALFLSLLIGAIGLDFLYSRFHADNRSELQLTQQLWQHLSTAETATLPAGAVWIRRHELAWPDENWQQLQIDRSLILQDDSDRRFFYGLHADNDQVLMLPIPADVTDHRHWYWLLAYYGTVALVVFLWLKPLIRDIDKLRQSVQQLGLPTADLVVPVQQRSALTPVATALRDLRRHTAELMALQRDIANAVSHDIRTPLARIRFALAMLPIDTSAPLHKGIQADLLAIEQLVDEMLQYAQFEHAVPKLQIQTIGLAGFVVGVVSRYQHQSVKFQMDIPAAVTVQFDPICLQRALQNLIDNALRYANSQIRIAWQMEQGRPVLAVEDDGPGMRQTDTEGLTEAFVADGQQAGYGLGLAIVKKICLWHGGDLLLGRSTSLGGARVMLRCFDR